ncbi:MAG TPA: SGNH/GDSL hydrolase family protein [Dongiaceae bacterium]|jgi:lysophospholipase L1-like esterase|nr:SGNH/GDSL hydrolase family protein [Dongiaceae bacterium]
MRLILKAITILAVTTGLYVAADIAVGYFFTPLITQAARDPGNVPAYRGQAYMSPDFLREVAREPGEWRQIYGTDLVTPPAYHGRYFNVDELAPTGNLYRRTIGAPGDPAANKPQMTVLLLGGSTVYGPEVPDGLTLASLLAARLDALDPAHRYVVYNAGVFAADSLQERDRLVYEFDRGLKPDIVISFGGGMDIVDGIYQAEPGKPAAFLRSRTGLRGFLHRILPLNIYHLLLAHASAEAETSHEKRAPAHLSKPTRVAALTAATAKAWYDNQLAMAELSKARGARFISVLQPSPYSSAFDHPTADIPYVRELTESEWPGLGAVAGDAQVALARESAALRRQGVEAIDLSDGFRGKTEDVFIDIGHLNATGHGILASEIAETVLHPAGAASP